MKKTVITILVALLALAFIPSCVSKEVARIKEKKSSTKATTAGTAPNATAETTPYRGTAQTYQFPECDMEPPLMGSGSYEIKDSWDTGFYVMQLEETGMFFAYTSNPDITLEIYVLDEEFQDGLRYIPQAYEPAAIDDAIISVDEGQWIYIYCSDNSYTTSEPSEGEISWSLYRGYV